MNASLVRRECELYVRFTFSSPGTYGWKSRLRCRMRQAPARPARQQVPLSQTLQRAIQQSRREATRLSQLPEGKSAIHSWRLCDLCVLRFKPLLKLILDAVFIMHTRAGSRPKIEMGHNLRPYPDLVLAKTIGVDPTVTFTAPCVKLKHYRECEGLEETLLVLNRLLGPVALYWKSLPLFPVKKHASCSLALPPLKCVTANRAAKRGLRNIAVKHPHRVTNMAKKWGRKIQIFCRSPRHSK